eukprot:scaffold14532_cov101-Isochrysis_galbana.AAC.2
MARWVELRGCQSTCTMRRGPTAAQGSAARTGTKGEDDTCPKAGLGKRAGCRAAGVSSASHAGSAHTGGLPPPPGKAEASPPRAPAAAAGGEGSTRPSRYSERVRAWPGLRPAWRAISSRSAGESACSAARLSYPRLANGATIASSPSRDSTAATSAAPPDDERLSRRTPPLSAAPSSTSDPGRLSTPTELCPTTASSRVAPGTDGATRYRAWRRSGETAAGAAAMPRPGASGFSRHTPGTDAMSCAARGRGCKTRRQRSLSSAPEKTRRRPSRPSTYRSQVVPSTASTARRREPERSVPASPPSASPRSITRAILSGGARRREQGYFGI